MANIPLQSITFPGLSDKYTTPTVDATLTQTGAAADAKKTGDEISGLKNDLTQGTFPVGNAENADQLTSTVGIEDKTPYLFRTSGGSVDIGDRETVNKIVGGTIVNNQLVDFDNISLGNVVTRTDNNAFNVKYTASNAQSRSILGTANITSGHKFLFVYDVTRVNQAVNCVFNVYMPTLGQYYLTGFGNTSKSLIRQINDSKVQLWQNDVIQDAEYDIDFTYQITDLTLDLGTSIADYVYSLETATAGAGVAWLKKHFPKQFDAGYQAYDAGSMQSVSGLTEHKMVGFNQWNEEWEQGTINTSTGAKEASSTRIRSKNYIPVLSGNTYAIMVGNGSYATSMRACFYDSNFNFVSGIADFPSASTSGLYPHTFTVPSNAVYMLFSPYTDYGTTYKNDICINLHWDGEKDGTYEPYKTWSYALDDSVTLRGIPKVDANGNLYYDGDEYLPDGTVNRRYGIVDLGTLNWSKYVDSNIPVFYQVLNINMKVDGGLSGRDTKCVKYLGVPWTPLSQRVDKTIAIHPTIQAIYIADSSYTDPEDFRLSMSGVYLVFPLETPTTETALPYQETQIVDDFGTEEFVLADGAFPVPVGHNTMYQNNLRAKLEMSPDSPDGDGLYVVQQESGENTYVPLASTSTIQDILTRLTALENA